MVPTPLNTKNISERVFGQVKEIIKTVFLQMQLPLPRRLNKLYKSLGGLLNQYLPIPDCILQRTLPLVYWNHYVYQVVSTVSRKLTHPQDQKSRFGCFEIVNNNSHKFETNLRENTLFCYICRNKNTFMLVLLLAASIFK